MKRAIFMHILVLTVAAVTAFGQGTEFTYQGQITNSSTPASGVFDFEFVLFDTALGGAQIGPTNVRSGVAVTSGIFGVNLDFGQSFPGGNRFLEIRVRQSGGGSFTTLSPRQPVSSAPYSIKSLNADTAQTAVSATTAANATTATTATNFTGSLAGDVTGSQGATTVARLQGRNVAANQPNNGQVLKFNTSNSQWEPANDETASGGGGGTITGVTAGTGLTGGGSSGSVTLNIASGGVNTAQLADGSVTDPKIASVSGAKVTGAVANATNAVNATNATQLGGIPASGFIQNTTNQQAGSNFNVSGTGVAGFFNATTNFQLDGNRILSNAGNSNLFAGVLAGNANPSGARNSFFGASAGSLTSSGQNNTFIGASAGLLNSTGSDNTFVGSTTAILSTGGSRNSFFGSGAGGAASSATDNSFFGANAGQTNANGTNNSLLGAASDVAANNLNFATAIGAGSIATASNSVTLGRNTDTVRVPGNLVLSGTFTGNLDASSITNGTLPAARGGTGISSPGAAGNFLRSNGSAWVSSGIAAADVPTGIGSYIQNQNVGPQASSNFNISGNGTIGGTLDAERYFQNGVRILNGTAVTAVGRNSGGSGLNNTNLGEFAGQTSTINTVSNTYVGARAGQSNADGNDNSMFGSQSGGNSSGSGNSFFGRNTGLNNSGNTNSFFGISAGDFNTTGSNNTAIGANADMGQPGLTFATAIGAGSSVALSNTIALGRSSGADRVFLWGPLDLGTLVGGGTTHLCRTAANQVGDCSSSRRYKTNIRDFGVGLDLIRSLTPVSFDWKDGGMHDLGLVAEDVAEIEPLLINLNSKGEIEGVKYDRIGVVLVNAIKEQQKQIDDQRTKIDAQNRLIEALTVLVCGSNPTAALCRENK